MSSAILRSAMAGASSGGRTFSALAAQSLTAPDAQRQPDASLATSWARGLLSLLALGELVADKTPKAPSRLELPGLSGRIVAGAACGVIIARRDADPRGRSGDTRARIIACALSGGAASVLAARGGTRWRAAAAARTGHDWIGAGVEDSVVLGLAARAARSD